MKIRTTERVHNFTVELFRELNIFSLESITMNNLNEFTSCLEGVVFNDNEEINLSIVFTENEFKSKEYLSRLLGIPFYLMVFQESIFSIYQINVILGEVKFDLLHNFDEEEFVNWWKVLKGHGQSKPFYESNRIDKSIFDKVIEDRGFSWGGNIDGFMFKNKKVVCIIENIYTQKNPIDSVKGDPRTYFKSKGPNYNSWKPNVLLSRKLDIPLFLITWNGKSQEEKIGFSIIDDLSPNDIVYRYNLPPYKNILYGKENIKTHIIKSLNEGVPSFR